MRFDELDLEDEILDGLDDMNFQEMTPVQEHTIPVILEGRDIIGCAQTGTGKTAAYTLPLLNRLLIEGNEDNVIKSVIIVPTRAHAGRQFGLADIPLDELLDRMELALLVLADERHGAARSRGARRTADTVNIILGVVRHVVIDDQPDILDVDAARHDIRSHQDRHLVVLEVEHHLLALRLFQVGMHGGHIEFHALERVRQLLDLELRRREDDRLRIGRLGEHLADDA